MRFIQLGRREVMVGVVAALATLAEVRAQKPDRLRRLGVLDAGAESDPLAQRVAEAFRRGLGEHGWAEGQNILIDYRWGSRDIERTRTYAAELVATKPDVIYAVYNAQVRLLSRQTDTIPIVFVGASDPVGAGYVESFARPGRNITGFTFYEPSLGGKWLEALKEIAPTIVRVATIVNPDTAIFQGTFYSRAIETAAAILNVEPIVSVVRSASDIERTFASLGQQPGSSVIIPPDTFTTIHAALIRKLAAYHRVPTIYGGRQGAADSGLMSYGPDILDVVRRSASYIDRILRGERPSELPVQTPTKFEMTINLKAAKELGLQVPPSMLARADELIE